MTSHLPCVTDMLYLGELEDSVCGNLAQRPVSLSE